MSPYNIGNQNTAALPRSATRPSRIRRPRPFHSSKGRLIRVRRRLVRPRDSIVPAAIDGARLGMSGAWLLRRHLTSTDRVQACAAALPAVMWPKSSERLLAAWLRRRGARGPCPASRSTAVKLHDLFQRDSSECSESWTVSTGAFQLALR